MIWHSTFPAGKVLQMLNNRYGPLWGNYKPMTTESKPAADNQLPSKSHCACHCAVYYLVNNQCIPGNWRTSIWEQCIFHTCLSTQLSTSVKYKTQNFPLTKEKARLSWAALLDVLVYLMLGNLSWGKAMKGSAWLKRGQRHLSTWAFDPAVKTWEQSLTP